MLDLLFVRGETVVKFKSRVGVAAILGQFVGSESISKKENGLVPPKNRVLITSIGLDGSHHP